jgi:hypothetical protein
MHAALAEVPVDDAVAPVLPEQLLEPFEVLDRLAVRV